MQIKFQLQQLTIHFMWLTTSFQVNFTFYVVNTKFVNLNFIVTYLDF